MPKVAPAQTSFTGGEFSPIAQGRIDSDRYKTGLDTCENYVPLIQGALTRRGGTHFVNEAKHRAKAARTVGFRFSTIQAYNLEFGESYIRIFKDRAIIVSATKTITGATVANPVVVTSAGHGLTAGDRVVISGVAGMVQLNNREFRVGTTTANTFELSEPDASAGINGTTYTAYSSGGVAEVPLEVATPYIEADLATLKFTQSADVLYITHPSYAPRKLTRTSHTSWTLTTINFLDGPYLPQNSTTTTLSINTASIGTGRTLTASAALFASTDVGRLVRMLVGGTWGYVKITAFTSSTQVTVDVIATIGGTGAVTTWRLGLWSATTGYPAAVTFHEDRLGFVGGNTAAPQRLDLSNSGDYENFAPSDASGTVVASNAISYSLNANEVNSCLWVVSDEKGLQIGTNGGEWIVKPSSLNEALSPTNVSAKKTSGYGSANIQPVQVGKATLFVQSSGRKLRDLRYFYEVDGFEAPDISKIGEHATRSGLTQLAYQQMPVSVIWGVRTDGVLVGCSYEREADALTVGWHRHIIGGYSDAANSAAIVESVSVIPSTNGQSEDLWLVVKRYVNGAVKRYIEYVENVFDDEADLEDAFFVDSGLSYNDPKTITAATQANPAAITANAHGFSNGDKVIIDDVLGMTELNGNSYLVANAATNTFEITTLAGTNVNSSSFTTYVSGGKVRKFISTITGLWHLNGAAVDILADGAFQSSTFVNSGAVTLSSPAARAHIGFNVAAKAKLLRIEAGAANGTAMGKTRRTHRIGFYLYRTLGVKFGFSFDDMNEIFFRNAGDDASRAVPLFSGIQSEEAGADYDFENQICIKQDQPFPGTILAVFPQMDTQDR